MKILKKMFSIVWAPALVVLVYLIYFTIAFNNPQPADPDDYTDRGPQGANNRFGQ